jgi:LuxR family maltose regulon positive regulatory protein
VQPFLQQQLESAQRQNHMGLALEIMVLQALQSQALRHTGQAVAVLQQALAMAESQGYIRLFADFGRQLAPLLRLAAEQGSSHEYICRLLAVIEAEAPAYGEPRFPQAQKLVESLSIRELEVLRLLAEGLSNREIAHRLHISPNTVRIHTSNIYRKLDVGNRTQAVSRARLLGFLA